MTEISRPWAGTTVGDAGPYTAGNWWDVWQSMMGGSGALAGAGNKGVCPGVGGQLEVTVTGANAISIAAGAAIIDGLFYDNTAAVAQAVSSATGGNVRDDRIVVRKSFNSAIQTARLLLVAGAEAGSPGPGTPTALTQDTTRQTYWDLPLARISITEFGVITLTDEREFLTAGSGMVKIEEAVIGADATYTFDNIPRGFRHLKIMVEGRCTDTSAIANDVYLQFNGDTGANYNNQGAQLTDSLGTDHYMYHDAAVAYIDTGIMIPSDVGADAAFNGAGEVTIFSYNNVSRYKTANGGGGYYGSVFYTQSWGQGVWLSAAAIKSIKVYCDSDFDAHPEFATGSIITLYGIP